MLQQIFRNDDRKTHPTRAEVNDIYSSLEMVLMD